MIETIRNNAGGVIVNYTPTFSAICSVGLAPFWGNVEIEYQAGDVLLEFESFEKWLRTLVAQQVTIEDLARLVFDELARALGDIPLRVTIHARTTVHAPVSATIFKDKESQE